MFARIAGLFFPGTSMRQEILKDSGWSLWRAAPRSSGVYAGEQSQTYCKKCQNQKMADLRKKEKEIDRVTGLKLRRCAITP